MIFRNYFFLSEQELFPLAQDAFQKMHDLETDYPFIYHDGFLSFIELLTLDKEN